MEGAWPRYLRRPESSAAPQSRPLDFLAFKNSGSKQNADQPKKNPTPVMVLLRGPHLSDAQLPHVVKCDDMPLPADSATGNLLHRKPQRVTIFVRNFDRITYFKLTRYVA